VGHSPAAVQSELARVLELGDELRKLLLELLTSKDLVRASTAGGRASTAGGRASTAGGRVSDSCSGGAPAGSMEAPNMAPTCNDPDAPRSAVPGMLRI
jgi:hypothetical protein